MRKLLWALGAIFFMLCIFTRNACADIVVGATRVIYNANQTSVSVPLTNQGKGPRLVQTWVDEEGKRATPTTTQAPFIATPALVRVNPDKGQTIQLVYTKEALAKDKETLFWLNVLEMAPKDMSKEAQSENKLIFSFCYRIKLFYRPLNLKPARGDAEKQLVWKIIPNKKQEKNKGSTYALQLKNPTPYYITITEAKVKINKVDYEAKLDGLESGLVAPNATVTLPLPKFPEKGLTDSAQLEFQSVNDYGGYNKQQVVLRP